MIFTNIEIVKNFKSDTLILNTYWSTLVRTKPQLYVVTLLNAQSP